MKTTDDLTTTVTAEAVRRVTGPIGDRSLLAILEIRPSLNEIEIAAAYADGDGDVLGQRGKPLEGKAAQIHDILIRDALYAPPEEP